MIKTDHESLKHLLEQRISTPLQQKGMMKLMGLNYTIQYKKGKENAAANALSRRGGRRRDCFSHNYGDTNLNTRGGGEL